jgi:uncharacterized protein YsxB (DUF464 family)
MVEVRFRRDRQGRLSSIEAGGHAGWAEEGSDVVCAAVSALLQAAWLGLTDHAHVAVEATRSKGDLQLRWPAEVRDRADVVAIAATAELAVAQIARQYGDHVRYHAENEDG